MPEPNALEDSVRERLTEALIQWVKEKAPKEVRFPSAHVATVKRWAVVQKNVNSDCWAEAWNKVGEYKPRITRVRGDGKNAVFKATVLRIVTNPTKEETVRTADELKRLVKKYRKISVDKAHRLAEDTVGFKITGARRAQTGISAKGGRDGIVRIGGGKYYVPKADAPATEPATKKRKTAEPQDQKPKPAEKPAEGRVILTKTPESTAKITFAPGSKVEYEEVSVEGETADGGIIMLNFKRATVTIIGGTAVLAVLVAALATLL
jgi:hypothetical protein